jgi:hypothetical protein
MSLNTIKMNKTSFNSVIGEHSSANLYSIPTKDIDHEFSKPVDDIKAKKKSNVVSNDLFRDLSDLTRAKR